MSSTWLAVSSRNQYLTGRQRKQATALHRSMVRGAEEVTAGHVDVAGLRITIEDTLMSAGSCTVDYIKFVDPQSLRELDRIVGPARICLAVRIGRCRLIDNLAVEGPPMPR